MSFGSSTLVARFNRDHWSLQRSENSLVLDDCSEEGREVVERGELEWIHIAASADALAKGAPRPTRKKPQT